MQKNYCLPYWSHSTYEIISGKQPYYIHAKSSESKKHYVIINYDILKEWSSFLSLIPFDCMVIDECHYIANFKSQRTKETVTLSKSIDRFVALSGTPFKNRPVEFFMVLNIINPTMFPTFMDYGIRYCDGQKNKYGWDFTGSSNMDELHEKLKDIMIRRVKGDVLKELPPKMRNVVPIQISNQKEYSQASNDFRTWLLKVTKSRARLDKALKAEALVKIEHLKQLVLKGKKKQIIQWVRDFLSVEDKLVLFGIHKSALDFLEKEFSDICVKVDGSVKDYEREKAVSDFQNNKDIKLFLGNIKAAGVGLTLTTASSTAFIELPWTPADLEQAEDRVHRIGQAKHVNSYYLIDESTIEGDLRDLIWDKKDIKDAILDGLDILPRLNRQEF
ncbi:MAG: DEAD/DEAH box helicase [Desulfamplus sp.]|nr:DEAD/DEAH box helicase [Desulfamplus sp.]